MLHMFKNEKLWSTRKKWTTITKKKTKFIEMPNNTTEARNYQKRYGKRNKEKMFRKKLKKWWSTQGIVWRRKMSTVEIHIRIFLKKKKKSIKKYRHNIFGEDIQEKKEYISEHNKHYPSPNNAIRKLKKISSVCSTVLSAIWETFISRAFRRVKQ